MRILILASTLARGGTEQWIALTGKELRCRGHRVLVAALSGPYDRKAELEKAGVDVCSIDDRTIIEGFAPDWIHISTYDRHVEWTSWAAKICPNVALIYHHVPAYDMRAALRIGLLHPGAVIRYISRSWIFRSKLKLFFGCGEESARNIRRSYPLISSKRIYALVNGIQIPDCNSESVLSGSASFIQVGSLVERKQPMLTLRAFEQIARGRTDLRLTFVGGGPLEKNLVNYVNERSIVGVSIVGERESVEPYFREANVIVLPSLNEGLPYSLIEGAGRKMALVASCVGGNAEICRHMETGVLTDKGDLRSLKVALGLLAENTELRQQLGSRARELVISRHDLQKNISHLVGLYEAYAS